ncbi:nuclear transport factor 2 family protein [Rhodopseudomonas sp. HC1]|uniref:nuclear transport factor 2 family protein n=1 Tax=Rhodopseudomonas infernalis TaxID=2897386 RepID=UPI001EE8D014|nr:nuclear transport factor 2 family protein [Rhodopseudomonas infernalis]MCG6206567.1 nuclear transport factor 2 family protein [Rhodopseudomonas infernalis]
MNVFAVIIPLPPGLTGAAPGLQFAPFQIIAQRIAKSRLPTGRILGGGRRLRRHDTSPPTAMVAVVRAQSLVCIEGPDRMESRMSDDTYALAAASQQTIAAWHRALPAADVPALTALLTEDVTFFSPTVQSPIRGREATLLVLRTVAEVLQNIRYRRILAGGPCEAALEFSAEIGKLPLNGINLMRFDADGRIREFEVMMRPLRSLSAVADAVGNRVAPRMLELKLKASPGNV